MFSLAEVCTQGTARKAEGWKPVLHCKHTLGTSSLWRMLGGGLKKGDAWEEVDRSRFSSRMAGAEVVLHVMQPRCL